MPEADGLHVKSLFTKPSHVKWLQKNSRGWDYISADLGHCPILVWSNKNFCRWLPWKFLLKMLRGMAGICNTGDEAQSIWSALQSPHPDHFSHVALRASVLSGILDLYQHDEEEVVPHVVFNFDVLLEGHCLIVKFIPLQTWNNKGQTTCVGVTFTTCSLENLFHYYFLYANLRRRDAIVLVTSAKKGHKNRRKYDHEGWSDKDSERSFAKNK